MRHGLRARLGWASHRASDLQIFKFRIRVRLMVGRTEVETCVAGPDVTKMSLLTMDPYETVWIHLGILRTRLGAEVVSLLLRATFRAARALLLVGCCLDARAEEWILRLRSCW